MRGLAHDAFTVAPDCIDYALLFLMFCQIVSLLNRFMHHDRLRAVLGHISPPGFFGRPTRITSAFTFKADAAFLDGGALRFRGRGSRVSSGSAWHTRVRLLLEGFTVTDVQYVLADMIARRFAMLFQERVPFRLFSSGLRRLRIALR